MMNLNELLEMRSLIDTAIAAIERIERWRRGAGVEEIEAPGAEEIQPAAAEPEPTAPAPEPAATACIMCGTTFPPRTSGKAKVYCSARCRTAAHTATARAKRQKADSAPADDAEPEQASSDTAPAPGAPPERPRPPARGTLWQLASSRPAAGDHLTVAELTAPPALPVRERGHVEGVTGQPIGAHEWAG